MEPESNVPPASVGAAALVPAPLPDGAHDLVHREPAAVPADKSTGNEKRPKDHRSVTEWKRLKKTHPAEFAAAKHANRWDVGPEVDPTLCDEATYDAAIATARNLSIG